MILYESDARSFEDGTICDCTLMRGCPAAFISAPVGIAFGQLQESTAKELSDQQQTELLRCGCVSSVTSNLAPCLPGTKFSSLPVSGTGKLRPAEDELLLGV